MRSNVPKKCLLNSKCSCKKGQNTKVRIFFGSVLKNAIVADICFSTQNSGRISFKKFFKKNFTTVCKITTREVEKHCPQFIFDLVVFNFLCHKDGILQDFVEISDSRSRWLLIIGKLIIENLFCPELIFFRSVSALLW